jgi:hypothetical protein
MKTHGFGRWAVLALLLILAIPMRADAGEHWFYHHHVVVPAYGVGYRVAPRYVPVPSVVPSYAGYQSYAAVPAYGASYGAVPSVAPVYGRYPYGYHLSKAQIAYYNRLGRMERYAANHPAIVR